MFSTICRTDIPNGSGFYAIKKIQEIDPNVKIIAVTADMSLNTEEKLSKLKVPIIYKSFDMQQVISTIEHYFSIFGIFRKPLYRILTAYQCSKMSKRVTIMIDDELDKKLRLRQAKLIQSEQKSFSYSKVLNDVLRKSLK